MMIRSILVITFCFALVSAAKAQHSLQLNMDELLRISEKADLAKFRALTARLDFMVLDSSKMPDGTLSYVTREKRFQGDALSCKCGKDKRIQFMIYRTKSKDRSESMKMALLQMGFIPGKIHKNEIPGILEAQDYIKNDRDILFMVMEQDGDVWYEIDFTKN